MLELKKTLIDLLREGSVPLQRRVLRILKAMNSTGEAVVCSAATVALLRGVDDAEVQSLLGEGWLETA